MRQLSTNRNHPNFKKVKSFLRGLWVTVKPTNWRKHILDIQEAAGLYTFSTDSGVITIEVKCSYIMIIYPLPHVDTRNTFTVHMELGWAMLRCLESSLAALKGKSSTLSRSAPWKEGSFTRRKYLQSICLKSLSLLQSPLVLGYRLS